VAIAKGGARPLAGAILVLAAIVFASVADDGRAEKVAERALTYSGGVGSKLKYARFVYTYEENGKVQVSRTHLWDVRGQRHRYESADEDGKNVVCLTYLSDKMGVCAVDGVAMLGADAKPWIDRALAAWTNDSTWLLMPYKLEDPGVKIEYAGEDKDGSKVYDELRVSFGTGEAPTEAFLGFFERETGRMDRSEIAPRPAAGAGAEARPTLWRWTGWEPRGGMMFSTERATADGKRKIRFSALEVYENLPELVFAGTSPVDLSKLSPSPHR